MILDFLLERFWANKDRVAFIYLANSYTYQWLIDRIEYYNGEITSANYTQNSVVSIISEPNPESIALFLALINRNFIVVPITPFLLAKKDEYYRIAQVNIEINLEQTLQSKYLNQETSNELLKSLQAKNESGLILFSSGTSGNSKASLHSFERLLLKYKNIGKNYRTLAFMHFDHIGGIDTLFYGLSNASTMILQNDRSPKSILESIEKYKVEVLPVTPTFLNMLILSELYNNYDLSSLKIITYGTEVMPEFTLNKCVELFPQVKFIQKYGTTEVGTLSSKSESNSSLWVKIGGEGYQTRIVDGQLQIKSPSAMIGYLNAPSPFTADGWFITGDRVEVKDDFYRILGRESEIINIGGEKVYPAEVENLLLKYNNLKEAFVYGEKNPLMGQMLIANVSLLEQNENTDLRKEANSIKKFMIDKIETYKIPSKINILNEEQFSERFKKIRKAPSRNSDGDV